MTAARDRLAASLESYKGCRVVVLSQTGFVRRRILDAPCMLKVYFQDITKSSGQLVQMISERALKTPREK